jgi:hypothetical protein
MLGDLPEVDKEVNVKLEEDDDEELDREFKASVKDGERGAEPISAMDVDEKPEIPASVAKKEEEAEEEEDPLEAYMRGVTEEKV